MSAEILDNYLDAEFVDTRLEASIVSTVLEAELTRIQNIVFEQVVEVPNAPLENNSGSTVTLNSAAFINRLILDTYINTGSFVLPADSTYDPPLGTWYEFHKVSGDRIALSAAAVTLLDGDREISGFEIPEGSRFRITKIAADTWKITDVEAYGSETTTVQGASVDVEWSRIGDIVTLKFQTIQFTYGGFGVSTPNFLPGLLRIPSGAHDAGGVVRQSNQSTSNDEGLGRYLLSDNSTSITWVFDEVSLVNGQVFRIDPHVITYNLGGP